MMTKQDIRRELTHGDDDLGMITLKRIADFYGVSDAYKLQRKLLAGLEKFGKYYSVKDVVDRIYQTKK